MCHFNLKTEFKFTFLASVILKYDVPSEHIKPLMFATLLNPIYKLQFMFKKFETCKMLTIFTSEGPHTLL